MTVVVTKGGQVAQVKRYPLARTEPRSVAPQRGRVRLYDAFGRTATYEAMYRSQPWVYAVVNKLVYGLARLPLKTYVYGDSGDRERAERGNDLDRLIRRPWPRWADWHLKVHIGWDLFVHGQAALLTAATRAGAPPTELWPVPWRNVETLEDESGIVGYSIIGASGTRFSVDPGRIVHFTLPGRVSPMEPLRRTLAIEDAAMTWQGENFRNGITPRGAFTTEQKINEKTLPVLREELTALYAGPENGGRFGIFDQGLKWSSIGMSAVDAALIDQRKLSREEVCAAYDVPPPTVGILDRATFNNTTEMRKQLYIDALGPKAVLVESTLNAQLVDPVAAWDGYFLEFDMDGVLRPDAEARYRAHLMAQQSSTSSVNERRRLENLPPIGNPDDPTNVANQVLLPANMIPTGHYEQLALEGAAPAAPDGGAAAPEAASLAQALVAEAFRVGTGDPDRTVGHDEEV